MKHSIFYFIITLLLLLLLIYLWHWIGVSASQETPRFIRLHAPRQLRIVRELKAEDRLI